MDIEWVNSTCDPLPVISGVDCVVWRFGPMEPPIGPTHLWSRLGASFANDVAIG